MRAASLLLRAAELGNHHAMWQIGTRFEKVRGEGGTACWPVKGAAADAARHGADQAVL